MTAASVVGALSGGANSSFFYLVISALISVLVGIANEFFRDFLHGRAVPVELDSKSKEESLDLASTPLGKRLSGKKFIRLLLNQQIELRKWQERKLDRVAEKQITATYVLASILLFFGGLAYGSIKQDTSTIIGQQQINEKKVDDLRVALNNGKEGGRFGLESQPSEQARRIALSIPADSGPAARGWKAIGEGNLQEAQKFALESEAQDRKNRIGTLTLQSEIHYFTGNYLAAAQCARTAVHMRPSDPILLKQYGATLQRIGKYKEAVEVLNHALALHAKLPRRADHHAPITPDSLAIVNDLAMAYDALGETGKARLLFEDSLEMTVELLGTCHVETASAQNNLAYCYWRIKRKEEAEELCRKALAGTRNAVGNSDPRTANSLINLGAMLFLQGKTREAVPLYEEALAILEASIPDHPDTADCDRKLAQAYRKLGRNLEAQILEAMAKKIEVQHKAMNL